MTPDRWADIDRIHIAALERTGPDRVAFLDAACAGDAELRREVESLLKYATAAEGFLERPALQEAAGVFDADAAARASVLPVVPGYTVLELLGTGGMGVVYLAEENPPLRRRVALKLIRPGLDTVSVLARFEAERQALALMDHPNIAAVFGTGVSADRRPFVAMEFVAGVPITEYCDRARLSIEARLDMFVRVCAAVQHAHQKGVIHRDLKPSNVLVSEQDGQPVPKVIDFGTAAWADRPRGDRLGLTDAGTIVGTLEYMSPEQAAASTDIDTTTDVYSLGVLLYELLVGDVPFDRQRLRDAGYDEMRRVILESDPPRPSAQLARGAASTSSTASARGTDIGRLTRQLTGDLDWIVLRALEKDRRRRYPTVAAFATDIDRFLGDQPVDARPPSAAYRVGKFARRHRGAVSAAALLLVVLVAGFLTSTALYFRAERARADANRQRQDADDQRVIAGEQRSAAEQAALAAGQAAAAATQGRNDAVAANAEADRLRSVAEKQVGTVNAALLEAEYRRSLATIGAADGDIRSNQPRAARERLLMVPVAQRDWEWRHLFLKTDASVLALTGAPCDGNSANLPGIPRELGDPLVLSDQGGRIGWTHCNVLDQWETAGFSHSATVAPPGTRFLGANTAGLMLKLSKHLPSGWDLQLVGRPASLAPVTFGPFTKEPACAIVSPDGKRIAVGLEPPNVNGENADDVFEVWSVETGQLVARLLPPRPVLPDSRSLNSSCMIQFSPDGSRVATSGGTVHVWVTESGVELRADGEQAGIAAQPVAFSPDGTSLAIGRVSGLVDIVNVTSATKPVTHLEGNGLIQPLPLPEGLRRNFVISRRMDAVSSVAFSPDASQIVSGFGLQVGVWDVTEGKLVKVLAGHQVRVMSVLVRPDGRFIFSADERGNLRIWPAEGSDGITRVPGLVGHSTSFAVRADGRAVAVGGLDASVAIWRLDELSQLIVRPGSGREDLRNAARSLVFTGDGHRLLAGEDASNLPAGTIRSLTLRPQESLALSKADSPDPPCADARPRARFDHRLAVSNDGKYLALRDGLCVLVRELGTMKTLATLDLRIGAENQLDVEAFQFRPDGALIVGSRHGQTLPPKRFVRIWDWRSGRLLGTADRTTFPSTTTSWDLAISTDGKRIAMVDGIVSIWDGDLTREIDRLPATNIRFAAFSADGRRIATANNDESVVRVWDSATFQQVLTLTDVESHRYGVAFTPDGRLIAGRTSGGLTIWESQKQPCDVCDATEQRLRAELQALETAECTEGEQEVPGQGQRVFVLNPRRTCWTPWLMVGGIGGIDYKETGLVLIQIVQRDGTMSEGIVGPGKGLPWSGKPILKVRYKSLGKGPVTITFTVQ